jgi:hypothetical protein
LEANYTSTVGNHRQKTRSAALAADAQAVSGGRSGFRRCHPEIGAAFNVKCAACSEEIQDDALKCKHCGTILIPSDWQRFCQSYANMTEALRAVAWEQLSAGQREAFSRFVKVVQPVPTAAQPPASGTPTGNTVAALASFFIPGLGQLVQGRIGMAFLFFVLATAFWFILLGWIIHLVAAVEAAQWKG